MRALSTTFLPETESLGDITFDPRPIIRGTGAITACGGTAFALSMWLGAGVETFVPDWSVDRLTAGVGAFIVLPALDGGGALFVLGAVLDAGAGAAGEPAGAADGAALAAVATRFPLKRIRNFGTRWMASEVTVDRESTATVSCACLWGWR